MSEEEAEVECAIKWVIVWCDEDLSFSLISKEDAVCDVDHLSVDDKLVFSYNNRDYDGVVRALGGDKDYSELVLKLKELNASNRKKEDSFHADQPRKTRAVTKPVNAVNSSKAKTSQTAPKPTKVDVNKCFKTEQGCSGSSGSATSSPESSPPPELMTDRDKTAVAVKRKGKEQDLQILKNLRSEESPPRKPRHSIMGFGLSESPANRADEPLYNSKMHEREKKGTSSTLVTADEPKLDDRKKHKRENERNSSKSSEEEMSTEKSRKRRKKVFSSSEEDCDTEDKGEQTKKSGKDAKETKETSSDEEPTKEDKKGGERLKKKMNQGNSKANGKVVKKCQEADPKEPLKMKKEQGKEAEEVDFPVMRCSADDDNVEAISGKSKELANKTFYITSDYLHKAKSAKNASIFSKTLLEAAFTDEALYKCSVSGGEYRAGGRDNIARKPALPSTVISLILDVALHRQQVKKWNPPLNRKELLGGLRQKLVDIRPRLKKSFENQEV